jgi:hypothetical protein
VASRKTTIQLILFSTRADRINAILVDILHGSGNDSADPFVVVGGNGVHLSDSLAFHGLVNTALQGLRDESRRAPEQHDQACP